MIKLKIDHACDCMPGIVQGKSLNSFGDATMTSFVTISFPGKTFGTIGTNPYKESLSALRCFSLGICVGWPQFSAGPVG